MRFIRTLPISSSSQKIGARCGPDASWLPAYPADELRSAVHDNLRNLSVDDLDVVNLRNMGSRDSPLERQLTVLDLQQ